MRYTVHKLASSEPRKPTQLRRPTAERPHASGENSQVTLNEVYDRLLEQHGHQHWWPADSPFEVMVGAVLVQSTAWANAVRAIHNLKPARALSPAAIRRMSIEELEKLVRPSGFFRGKARRLKALCEYLGEKHSDDMDAMTARPTRPLRNELLGIYGVGPETADDILLYALGHPVFVVDAYTRRLFHRLGQSGAQAGYHELQAMFHKRLTSRDAHIFNEYHALIVRHSTSICRPHPLCSECSLDSLCPKLGV